MSLEGLREAYPDARVLMSFRGLRGLFERLTESKDWDDPAKGMGMRPYMLKAGEGWTYRYDINFTVKAGELYPGRGATFTEYTTQKGEEPSDHTHPREDEMFYVLKGELAFRCGGESFDVSEGGFVYLPQGNEHGYTILSEEPVHLIVVTFPASTPSDEGWGGFIADVEGQGKLVAEPDNWGE